MRRFGLELGLSLSLIVSACATHPASPNHEGSPRSSQWAGDPERAAWVQFAREAIDSDGKGLLTAQPGDAAAFCPNYAALSPDGRKTFWAAFLATLSLAESGNNPAKQHFEIFNADAGRPVIRRGLFQISIESAHRKIYKCDVSRARDLADPKQNIACAVRILDHWVETDGVIAAHDHSSKRGAANFWHSFGDGSVTHAIEQQTAAACAETAASEVAR